MNPNWKETSKFWLIRFAIGLLLVLPYFLWHSFWLLGIGIIIMCTSLCYLIYSLFKNTDSASLGIPIFICILFSLLCFLWHDDRYITENGNKQHLYEDCISLSRSKDIKMVTKAEGFFYLKFSDCKTCKNRKELLKARKKAEKMERERNKLRSYLQDLIDRLDEGEDPDDIEDMLIKDWSREEDDDDYIGGVPSRYLP